MPNFYVLTESAGTSGAYTVAIHVPIPSVNNLAGVNYQVALINSGIGGSTILPTGTGPGQISPTELANILSGATYEVIQDIKPSGNNLASIASNMQGIVQSIQSSTLIYLQQQLQYFGYSA